MKNTCLFYIVMEFSRKMGAILSGFEETLNFHLPLRGLVKSWSLLKFVCLFQFKFNFSIKNILSRVL